MRAPQRFLTWLLVGVLLEGCGSRTELLISTASDGSARDGAQHVDASLDLPEASADSAADVVEDSASDAADDHPPLDAAFRATPPPAECHDAGSTNIYLITAQSALYSFYPPSLSYHRIGVVSCPMTAAAPFSMAVNRQGIAYSVFVDGHLFRIDTTTAACTPTTFRPGQNHFVTFGMGYVANTQTLGETLFVDEASGRQTPSLGLATIDTSTMTEAFVRPFSQKIPGAELTGTADGRLFAFYTNAMGPSGSHLVEVDRTTGDILTNNQLQIGAPNDGYAFAFWGGAFWIFTEGGGPTTVTRFDPKTMEESYSTTLPESVVGAGASTCAPD